jgi:hypothetical protein
MVYFQIPNPTLGKFWRALEWKLLVFFIVTRNILRTFGIFNGHLVYFRAIWYILGPFGNVVVNLVYFPPFWITVWRKIWQPSGGVGAVGLLDYVRRKWLNFTTHIFLQYLAGF